MRTASQSPSRAARTREVDPSWKDYILDVITAGNIWNALLMCQYRVYGVDFSFCLQQHVCSVHVFLGDSTDLKTRVVRTKQHSPSGKS
jgi:hypothetical protein